MSVYVCLFLDLPLPAAQIATKACVRLASAFRPATRRAYERMFRDFVAFLVAARLSILNHFCLLAFMEYLCQNKFSPANIHNYLAGVRTQFIVHNLDTSPFQNQQLQLFHKSIKTNRLLHPKAYTYIDIDLFTYLVSNVIH